MTCIVGIEHKGKVYIAGDSAGVSGYSISVRDDRKVHVIDDFAFGFTSSFRMGQLLAYDFTPPKHPKKKSDMHYLVSDFVKALRVLYKKGGFLSKEHEQETGGTFLLGYHGKLYTVDSDFQVARTVDGYDACGCGCDLALGALYTLTRQLPTLKPEGVLKSALEASAYHSAGVVAPFHIVSV